MQNPINQVNHILKSGQFNKALKLTQNLLNSDPDNLTLIKFLAEIHFRLDDFYLAIETLNKIYQNNSDDFDLNNNLGLYYKQVEKFNLALKHIDRAKSINAEAPTPYHTAGDCYLSLRKFDLAQENYDKAISLFEALNTEIDFYLPLLISRIQTYLAKDDKQGSMEFIKSKLDQNFHPELVLMLAEINSQEISSQMLETIKKEIQQKIFKSRMEKFHHVVPMCFTLAKYYEKEKKNKLSEHYYIQGNKEILDIQRYNILRHQKKILNIIDIFQNMSIDALGKGDEHVEKIFITGMPRSGTSLLESIITANDYVFAAGELRSFELLCDKYLFQENPSSKDACELIGKEYNEIANFMKANYSAIVDKMPANFNFLGLMYCCLPGAKFILTKRNHWDIAISLFKQRYVSNIPYASSFFNIGVYMANYEAITSFWLKNETIKKNVMVVEYEDLVSNENVSAAAIYKFCGIPSSYSSTIRQKHFAKTASIGQVGNKISAASIQKSDFADQKSEFLDAYKSQKEFWVSKGILS